MTEDWAFFQPLRHIKSYERKRGLKTFGKQEYSCNDKKRELFERKIGATKSSRQARVITQQSTLMKKGGGNVIGLFFSTMYDSYQHIWNYCVSLEEQWTYLNEKYI